MLSLKNLLLTCITLNMSGYACMIKLMCFFFQAEDGIRVAQESRGLGDVYKRQRRQRLQRQAGADVQIDLGPGAAELVQHRQKPVETCLLYTSDAADDLLCVDLGGRRIIKKKKRTQPTKNPHLATLHRQYAFTNYHL